MRDALTHVELTWVEKRTEHWIRFGRIADNRIIDRRRRVVSFRAGEVFARIRWSANDYGTVASHVDIVQAVGSGAAHTTLSAIDPGGDILLSISGWPKVEAVLRLIETIDDIGIDPCDVAPDYWRHVHNRMVAGFDPRPYTKTRHRVWLARRELAS